MGKGGAQLGKAVKGKSKDKKDKKLKLKESVQNVQLDTDLKQLEEYEKLTKMAEANKERLKKLYQQEELNTRLNKMLLLNFQRKFMRAAKVESLRGDMEMLSQNHQRDVDRKDAIIKMLAQDLDDAEEQYERSQRTHSEKIDELIALHHSRIRRLDEEFERDLKALKLEFETERQHIISQHTRESKELNGIIAAVEEEEKKKVEDAKQAHETEREEIRNKNLEDINMLRINLENKIEDLERQFDEAHQQYVEQTDQANRHFKKLVKKDRVLNKQIELQKHKIERFQAKLSSWRKITVQNESECKARNQALRTQREAIAKHCADLKLKMKNFRDEEQRRLRELTLLSREALQANNGKLEFAEKILKLAELCRKFETEKEKVVPFYQVEMDADMQAALATKEKLMQTQMEANGGQTTNSDEFVFAPTESANAVQNEAWFALDNFYKKYNKVLLDKLAIQQEKERLSRENEELKGLLKQYLDGIAVTETALDGANPLMIVNNRVNLLPSQQVRRKGPPAACLEANTIVRNYAASMV